MGRSNRLDFSTPEAFAGIMENIRNRHYSRKTCEARDIISTCDGKIIQSHSISRKFLKQIADKSGQVYRFDDRLHGLIDRDGGGGVAKVGCTQASTYNMFCASHDKKLFSSIEDVELIPNEVQCLMLAYRALMMEKYLKESQSSYLEEIVSQGISLIDGGVYEFMLNGVRMGLKDFESVNAGIADDIRAKDLSSFRALRIYFRKKPGFLCAGALHAVSDCNGIPLTALQSPLPIQDILSISILPLSKKQSSNGVAVLAWRDVAGRSDSQSFIDSLHDIPCERITDALIHFVFAYVENVCISPSWWESRDETVKSAILDLHMTFRQSPMNWRDISVRYDDWHAVNADLWNGECWQPFHMGAK